MDTLLDLILASYAGGMLWTGVGLILIFSVKKRTYADWRNERTDAEMLRRFLGVCSIILGILVILNLVYNHFMGR